MPPRHLPVLFAALAATSLALLVAASPGPASNRAPFTFVQMCDTQFGMGGYDHDVHNFEAAVEQINKLAPDFVVVCGDLVNDATEKSFADFNRVKAGFKIPCHCAAGNHDVENEPTAASLEFYRETIGPDYFSFAHKGYSFVIANTQLWKVDVPGESAKHDTWFKQTLTDARAKNTPVVVVTHYPLFVDQPDEKESYFNIAPDKRHELLALFEQSGVVAMLAGHTHRLKVNDYKGIQLVNGETTSKNFDKRPMGFRLWDADPENGLTHRFVALANPAPKKP